MPKEFGRIPELERLGISYRTSIILKVSFAYIGSPVPRHTRVISISSSSGLTYANAFESSCVLSFPTLYSWNKWHMMSSGVSDRLSEFDDGSRGKFYTYAVSAENLSNITDLDTNRGRFLTIEIRERRLFLLACTQLHFGNRSWH